MGETLLVGLTMVRNEAHHGPQVAWGRGGKDSGLKLRFLSAAPGGFASASSGEHFGPGSYRCVNRFLTNIDLKISGGTRSEMSKSAARRVQVGGSRAGSERLRKPNHLAGDVHDVQHSDAVDCIRQGSKSDKLRRGARWGRHQSKESWMDGSEAVSATAGEC